MRKLLLLVTLFASHIQYSNAQQVRPSASADIYRGLKQLNVLGTVMYVAAHPDDENTRLLSYLVHHDNVRTIYLSLTRGDGGQNILGSEQGSTLGLIRNYELLEARKIDGAEQLFTNVIDFGFTKSPEETFKFWDKNELTSLVYQAFQNYKPDVVICRFPTTGEGGHGQHTVSAIVAAEAYKMAKEKPESWIPKRLLFNSFRFGDRNTTSEDQFKIFINQYDPLLGEGYGEMAGRSRSVHKSQGAGTPQTVGLTQEYFKYLDGAPPVQSLYDEVDMSWNRVQLPEIAAQIEQVIATFDFKNPAASVPSLLNIRKEIRLKVKDSYWRLQKLKEIDKLIFSCAGIMAELITDKPEATPGTTLPFSLNILARYKGAIKIDTIHWPAMSVSTPLIQTQLGFDSLLKYPVSITINKSESPTEPYWLQEPASPSKYNYNGAYEALPEAHNDLSARIAIKMNDELLELTVPLSYKKLDPVRGDVVQRLRIVPPVSVKPFNSLFIYEKGKPQTAWIKLKAFEDLNNIQLNAYYHENIIASTSIASLANGRDTLISMDIPTNGLENSDNSFLSFGAVINGKKYNRSQELIQYDHIPELQYFSGTWMKAIEKNWEVRAKKIGYIEGAGDHVAGILNLVGVSVEYIPPTAMSSLKYLSNYDAIVVGVRAFNTKKEMASWMPTLLRYVENGGNLVIQYNTAQGLLTDQLGPYPLSVSRNRVTEEDAPITITDIQSPLLQYPNKITSKDFDNWIQERGIYYPENLDSRYKTMLSMHDTGEQPLNTAIVYTPYGKGHYIYTSLAFFRQLPAGNSGAIRLFMNLLSVGK